MNKTGRKIFLREAGLVSPTLTSLEAEPTGLALKLVALKVTVKSPTDWYVCIMVVAVGGLGITPSLPSPKSQLKKIGFVPLITVAVKTVGSPTNTGVLWSINTFGGGGSGKSVTVRTREVVTSGSRLKLVALKIMV